MRATAASHGTDASHGPRRWTPDVAVVFTLSVGLLVAIILLREPPVVYDPVEYFFAASRLPDVATNHRSLRLGLLLPIRAGQMLFAYSQAAYYLVPFLSGVGLIAGTYVLARSFFGRAVAASAGAAVVFNPYVLGAIHQIYPDLLSTALFTGGTALVVVAARRITHAEIPRADVSAHVCLVAAGLLFGWSYLVREFIVVLFPLALVILVAYRVPWRYLAGVALGALAVLVSELAWNAVVFDDPFIRFRALHGQAGGGRPPGEHLQDMIESRIGRRGSRFDRVVRVVTILMAPGVGPLFVGLGLAAVGSALVLRDRRSAVLLSWMVGYWAVVAALTIIERNEAGQTFLFANKARYWYPLLPPLIIGGLGVVSEVAGRLRGRTTGSLTPVLVLGLGLVSVVGTLVPMAARADEHREYEEFRGWLRTEAEPVDVVWTTQRTSWILQMFTRSPFGTPVWEGRVRPVNTAFRFADVNEVTGGYLVMQDSFFKPRFSNWREVTPDYLIDPPDRWSPVFVTQRSEIVVYDLEDGPERPDVTVVGEDDPWKVRTVGATDEEAASDRGPATWELDLMLDAGQRLVVSRENLVAGGLDPGDWLRMHVDVGAEGSGNVVPFCFFGDREGHRVRVEASSAWGLPSPYRQVELVCRIPPDLGDRYTVSIGMSVVGPVEARLGRMTATVIDGDADGG